MTGERDQLEQALAAQEGLRGTLADEVVDATVAALRDRLAAIDEASAEPQRRLATVLFADVKGFTALSETLDAEVVAELMNDVWAGVDTAIVDHGGRIDKHIGDAVMAVWGAGAGREDDAENAVRVALVLPHLVAATGASHGAELSIRVGVNTGPMLLGLVGSTAEFTAMGDAVNVASRLEHAAPVGGVLISHDTYAHVRGVFNVKATEPLVVKGKREPLRAYVVTGAKPRAFRMSTRGIEGVETQMIGRDRELEALRNAFRTVVEEGTAQSIVVVGDAGVGKSRLVFEFEDWLELQAEVVTYFKGRATPGSQLARLGVFRDLFAFRFEISDSDTTAAALAKFRAGMAAAGVGAGDADLIGHWVGFDFSSSPRVQALLGSNDVGAVARAHLMRYLHAVLAERPAVVILEDLHWADEASLDLLATLAGELVGARVLFAATSRPPLVPGVAALPVTNRIDLGALARGDVELMIDNVLQRVERVPPAVRELISTRAEGIPFYVEELVKMLLDEHVVVTGAAPGDAWVVAEDRLAALPVPATLTGVLQARLDALPAAELDALQRASVLGRVFWDAAVASLAQRVVDDVLDAARRRELIFDRSRSTFSGTREFLFKHALLRDVTYESVLLRDRTELHGRAARWLEDNAGERANEYLGVVAEHYRLAGNATRAAALLAELGEQALHAGNPQTARRAYESAFELDESGFDAVSGRAALADAYMFMAEYDRAWDAYAAARSAARAANETEEEVRALVGLARVRFALGEYAENRALLAEALELVTATNSPRRRDVLLYLVVHENSDDLDELRAWAEESVELAATGSDLALHSESLSAVAYAAISRDDLDAAEDALRKGAALAHESGNLIQEGLALANLGVVFHLRGDATGDLATYEEAAKWHREAIAVQQATGAREHLASRLGDLAQVELRLGRVADARVHLLDSMARLRALNSVRSLLYNVMFYAELLFAEGNRAGALDVLARALRSSAVDAETQRECDRIVARIEPTELEGKALVAAGPEVDLVALIDEILAREG